MYGSISVRKKAPFFCKLTDSYSDKKIIGQNIVTVRCINVQRYVFPKSSVIIIVKLIRFYIVFMLFYH